ncbi:MAG: glucose 1-dehydrogenase [Polyangiaceae bacterium]|nr:glucose 1-dehydrogenase [Polyangiaceae bacterium]
MALQRFLVQGQVAIVTGASSGIGRATAMLLSEAGANVVLAARGATRLFKVADEIKKLGRHALAVPTDVTLGTQLDALVNRTISDFGRIDILVNVAGGTPPTAALAVSDDDFDEAYHFNVTSALHLSRAAAPTMAKGGGGSIINISSAMSHQVDSGFVAYGAAKAALNHMTRLLAYEWAPKIRVNAVAAGATLTEALEIISSMEGTKEHMAQRTPLARLGEPDDIALAVLYLASSASSWVTGKILEVDGGAIQSVWPIPIPNGLP